jgi:hypothetical protein
MRTDLQGRPDQAAVERDDLHAAKSGTAALAACIVQTLNEHDPTFQKRFLGRLEKTYQQFGHDGEFLHQVELLSWTREYLTGRHSIAGHSS